MSKTFYDKDGKASEGILIEDINKCKWLCDEVWKDIKGYEGKYKISNLGNVKSVKKQIILKPIIHKKGYLRVALYKKNKSKRYLIHRLVAEAFIENPNNYMEINHKDENKQNNNVSNLEWCSRSYNVNYGTRNKSTSKNINQYDMQGNFIKKWESIKEVERQLGINNAHICQCCKQNERYKTAGGYIWRYADYPHHKCESIEECELFEEEDGIV